LTGRAIRLPFHLYATVRWAAAAGGSQAPAAIAPEGPILLQTTVAGTLFWMQQVVAWERTILTFFDARDSRPHVCLWRRTRWPAVGS
jgi:hypothetical protein